MKTETPPTLDYMSKQPVPRRAGATLRFPLALVLGGMFGILFGVATVQSGTGFICVGPSLSMLGSAIMITVSDRRRLVAVLFHVAMTTLAIALSVAITDGGNLWPETVATVVVVLLLVSLII